MHQTSLAWWLSAVRRLAGWSALLLIGAVCGSAQAGHLNYKYTYTSKPFTTVLLTVLPDYPPPFNVRRDYSTETISVEFTTASLLSAPGSYQDTIPFTVKLTPGSLSYFSELTSTAPYCFGEIRCNTVLDILGVDGTGLPTAWNISIDYYFRSGLFAPRLFRSAISTSTGEDNTYGGYEGFTEYAGQAIGQPGVWSVTAVPEPATIILTMLGLGALAVVNDRRRHITRLT